jgi:hypothetical protein
MRSSAIFFLGGHGLLVTLRPGPSEGLGAFAGHDFQGIDFLGIDPAGDEVGGAVAPEVDGADGFAIGWFPLAGFSIFLEQLAAIWI